MGGQGYFVPETTVRNIIEMLSTTDLPVKQIAQCTSCDPILSYLLIEDFRYGSLRSIVTVAPKTEGESSPRIEWILSG
jgi:hypothetical protein